MNGSLLRAGRGRVQHWVVVVLENLPGDLDLTWTEVRLVVRVARVVHLDVPLRAILRGNALVDQGVFLGLLVECGGCTGDVFHGFDVVDGDRVLRLGSISILVAGDSDDLDRLSSLNADARADLL